MAIHFWISSFKVQSKRLHISSLRGWVSVQCACLCMRFSVCMCDVCVSFAIDTANNNWLNFLIMQTFLAFLSPFLSISPLARSLAHIQLLQPTQSVDDGRTRYPSWWQLYFAFQPFSSLIVSGTISPFRIQWQSLAEVCERNEMSFHSTCTKTRTDKTLTPIFVDELFFRLHFWMPPRLWLWLTRKLCTFHFFFNCYSVCHFVCWNLQFPVGRTLPLTPWSWWNFGWPWHSLSSIYNRWKRIQRAYDKRVCRLEPLARTSSAFLDRTSHIW